MNRGSSRHKSAFLVLAVSVSVVACGGDSLRRASNRIEQRLVEQTPLGQETGVETVRDFLLSVGAGVLGEGPIEETAIAARPSLAGESGYYLEALLGRYNFGLTSVSVLYVFGPQGLSKVIVEKETDLL